MGWKEVGKEVGITMGKVGIAMGGVGVGWLAYKLIRYFIKRRVFTKQNMPTFKFNQFPLFKMYTLEGLEKILEEIYNEGEVREIIYGGPYFNGEPVLFVSDPESFRKVFNEYNFPKLAIHYHPLKVFFGEGLFTSSPPLWISQRKLLTPVFHFVQLKHMMPIMERNIRKFVERVREEGGEKIEPLNLFYEITARVIIDIAFGIYSDQDEDENGKKAELIIPLWKSIRSSFASYHFTSMIIGERITKRLPLAFVRNFINDSNKVRSIIKDAIDKKRAQPKLTENLSTIDRDNDLEDDHENSIFDSKKAFDLFSHLLDARDDDGNPLSDTQIIDEVITFIFAGHETTANTIIWAFYFLSRNENVYKELQKEIDNFFDSRPADYSLSFDDLPNLPYCKAVISETLRMRPQSFLDRITMEDCHLGGYFIPKGTYLEMVFHGTHYNPKYWKDPLIFTPERFLNQEIEDKSRPAYSYTPFSAGNRNCIGQKVAIQELISLLALTLRSFELKADPSERVVFSFKVATIPIGFYCQFLPRSLPSST